MKGIFSAATAVSVLGALAAAGFLALGSPKNKWCYVFQAHYWPMHGNGRINPPSDYRGIWREWSRRGQVERVSLYAADTTKIEDWFVNGNHWMRVSYLGTSGAACGYEYRFSPAGAVTFVGTYLKERPGDLIVIYDPHRQIDVRGKYRNVITRYAPLTSDKEAESGRGGN